MSTGMVQFCSGCKQEVVPSESFKVASNGEVMIKGRCPICKKYTNWVKYEHSYLVKKALKFYLDSGEADGITE